MSKEFDPTRRTLIKGGLLAAGLISAGKLAPLIFNEDRPGRPQTPTTEGAIPLNLLDPKVFIRPLIGKGTGEASPPDSKDTQTNLSPEQKLRLNAPVFTLVHKVSPGENMSSLIRKYYDPELVKSGLALSALIAANQETHPEPSSIKPGDELLIPVSEPVSVKAEGANPIEEAVKKYGFSYNSIKAVNMEGKTPGFIYLPIQAMPTLEQNEQLYITTPTDMSYYGIAQAHGYDLATLLGRNRPDASHLEHGHILITRDKSKAPEINPPKKVSPVTKPTPTPPTTVASQENTNPGTVEALKKRRTWHDVIDGSEKSAMLEQQITIEQLKGINLTPEGYKNFVNSINTEFSGAFEEAKTVHPAGIIDNPKYFILHHTAYGYKDGRAGVQQFVQSVINQRLSVQWVIDREGTAYQLVRNPKQACNHAAPFNRTSTGTEIMTDDTRAQGSLTDKQLESAMYLAYYVVTEAYGDKPDKLDQVVVGHRNINDRMHAGTAGKPDFFTNVIKEAVLPALDKLAAKF